MANIAPEPVAVNGNAATSDDNDCNVDNPDVVSIQLPIGWVRDKTQHVLVATGAIVASLLLTGNYHVVWNYLFLPMWNFVLHTTGTVVGIALGLGLAAHIYDRLDRLAHGDAGIGSSVNAAAVPELTSPTKTLSRGASSSMQTPSMKKAWGGDNDSKTVYAQLMSAAGYDVSDNFLRGQIVKSNCAFLHQTNYLFTNDPSNGETYNADRPWEYKAVHVMQEQWPHLPTSVSLELGKFLEHVMRDYVSSWYSMVDANCRYENEVAKRRRLQQEKAEQQGDDDDNEAQEPPQPPSAPRTMVMTTTCRRPIPLINNMYLMLSTIFGNLCQRVEGVNIFSLVLLKWTKVLSQNIKVYRQLRKAALLKQHATSSSNKSMRSSKSSSITKSNEGTEGENAAASDASEGSRRLPPVSEMAVTKEFLLRGKLHRAISFGMDVPSLLFADASGKECGDDDDNKTPDQVLEERLFTLLQGSELDYNRVLASRLARALLPRAEYSSPVLKAMVTELLAGSILTKIMSCFSPDYVNAWLLMACAGANKKSKEEQSGECSDNFVRDNDGAPEENGVELQLEDLETSASNDDEIQAKGDAETDVTPREVSSLNKSSVGFELEMNPTPVETRPTVMFDDTTEEIGEGAEREGDGESLDDFDVDGEEDDVGEESERTAHHDEGITSHEDEADRPPAVAPTGDFILPLLSMSMIDLQRFMDFEDCREAKTRNEQMDIKWDDEACQESVSQLVLIIESALIHGRRKNRLQVSRKKQESVDPEIRENTNNEMEDFEDDIDGSVEVSLSRYQPSSFSTVLMDMTSDVEAFEDRVRKEEESLVDENSDAESAEYDPSLISKPSSTELSTLRTLIAAWLHTGQAHRMVSALLSAPKSIVAPFFHKHAFLRTDENAHGFVRQLRTLEGVEILVDTMSVLSAKSMDVNNDGSQVVPNPDAERRKKAMSEQSSPTSARVAQPNLAESPTTKSNRLQRLVGASLSLASEQFTGDEVMETPKAANTSIPIPSGHGTSPYVDFRRNGNFASSLRTERERRTKSWLNSSGTYETKGVPVVCRAKGASEQSIALQREMHQIARVFYAGTNMLSIRNGARRNTSSESVGDSLDQSATSGADEVIPVSLVTVEMVGGKRRIEVPDEDSSFLLRAQARPLSAVGVHRDQRNHDQSYKCFAATYEEPAIHSGSAKQGGGRYIKRCLLRFYPNDRTASIVLSEDNRELDQRVHKRAPPETIHVGSSSSSYLSNEFLKERHLCQKWAPKGAAQRSGSILASSVMEISDFTAAPRSGKASEFIYRTSLFERPMVELKGKKFTIHDAAAVATHRADASALELSDAAISIALLNVGRDWVFEEKRVPSVADEQDENDGPPSPVVRRSSVETGGDGYPVIFVKFNRKAGDKTVSEVKPYRASYVRASLMITATRLEAQQACLIHHVKAGSAREATKARSEALLMPTIKLLDYASSPEREKQSILLRDLKLGINHIDREQLRRNGLLSPRHPTILHRLTTAVEGATSVKEPGAPLPGMAPSIVLYKIRCTAVVELADYDVDEEDFVPYASPDGTVAKWFKEEWVIYRSFRDFTLLHKQLKSQVAPHEQSASAGARLVGAATAAFTVGGSAAGTRRRKALMPSLDRASKAGALGVTKKAIQKRCGILDNYLKYLLSPTHIMNRCSELMLFVGTAYPLPLDIRTGAEPVSDTSEPFGRVAITRRVHIQEAASPEIAQEAFPRQRTATESSIHSINEDASVTAATTESNSVSRSISSKSMHTLESSPVAAASMRRAKSMPEERRAREDDEGSSRRRDIIQMIPSIKAKIDEVPLSKVRNALFELVRYQFDFDNASFFRNRMFAAMKTMSFAVTSSSEFRKMLYETHLKRVSADAMAGWIKFTLDMMWPEGVFYTSAPALTPEESKAQADKAKAALPDAFPDQLKSVIGQEIAQGGLDMLHEMLQNRIVVKSLAYMLFDLLWLEVFPELQDILTGGKALQSD